MGLEIKSLKIKEVQSNDEKQEDWESKKEIKQQYPRVAYLLVVLEKNRKWRERESDGIIEGRGITETKGRKVGAERVYGCRGEF